MIMKRTCLMILGCLVLGVATVSAQQGFGVGIIAGEPSGISAKLWLTETSALDGAAAWSFQDEGSFYIHADYLFHIHDTIPIDRGMIPFYVGAGASVTLEQDPRIGLRVPVGVEYIFEEAPVEIFLEAAPGVGLFPATEFQIGGGVGARFYF
jgi:hypothetical protein